MAVRLLSTKLLARTQPDEPIKASEFGAEALAILEAKYGKPEKGWTYLSLLVAIARMGGFLARKHDGMPGWQTIYFASSHLVTRTKALSCENCHAPNGAINFKALGYTEKEIDFLAVFIIPVNMWYVIPASALRGRKFGIALNPWRPRSKYTRYMEAWHLLNGGSKPKSPSKSHYNASRVTPL